MTVFLNSVRSSAVVLHVPRVTHRERRKARHQHDRGFERSTRAMATRCFMPPEVLGKRSGNRATGLSSSCPPGPDLAVSRSFDLKPKAILSATVIQGTGRTLETIPVRAGAVTARIATMRPDVGMENPQWRSAGSIPASEARIVTNSPFMTEGMIFQRGDRFVADAEHLPTCRTTTGE